MATNDLTNRFVRLRNAYNHSNTIDIDNLSSYFKTLANKATEKARNRFDKSHFKHQKHKNVGKCNKREKKRLLHTLSDSSDDDDDGKGLTGNSSDDDDGIEFTLLTESHETINKNKKRHRNENSNVNEMNDESNFVQTFDINSIAGDITRLPLNLQKQLKEIPPWMQLVNEIDSNIRQIRAQCFV